MSLQVVIGFWLLGALIGIVAADRRGFSRLAGIIGGALLGPVFACLLFLVSSKNRRCPSCVAWIPRAARTCQHCGHDVPPLMPSAVLAVDDDPGVIWRVVMQIVIGTAVSTAVVLVVLNLFVYCVYCS